MILNHKQAIEYLVHDAGRDAVAPETVVALHALLSDGLMADPEACGRLRRRAVEIGGSVYLPVALPQRLEELFGIVLELAAEVEDPFEQAFFLMVHLPYLQPFEDVNKRVSRLAANLPLVRRNLCPLSFLGVPEPAYRRAMLGVYEMTRVELLRDLYVWAYERSTQEYLAIRQELSEPDPLRLAWRELIKSTVRRLVQDPALDPQTTIAKAVAAQVSEPERATLQAMIAEEMRRLHEGVLARYGLRPSEWRTWKERSRSDQ